MFTGIVQHLGEIAAVTPCGAGRTLHVDARGWGVHPAPGDSVAVNGCCLTVTRPDAASTAGAIRFDVVGQTLRTTTLGDLAAGDRVNLEPAVTAATMMSGHIVQGHIDGTATVRSVTRRDGEHWLRIEPPPALAEYIVDKGSVAVDGVSLTVAATGEAAGNPWFEVTLIPTTLEITTLGRLREGGKVNLETDYVAKIVVETLRRISPRG